MSLRSAIDKLQSHEQTSLAIKDDKDRFIKQWCSDIMVLHDKMREFLKEYVADKSMKISLFDVNVEESGLGSYIAPALAISITDKTIQCTPRGRLTTDSTGRLDLWRSDRPSLSDRLKIVRDIGKGGKPGAWTIEQVSTPNFSKTVLSSSIMTGIAGIYTEHNFVTIDKESLESALERLLGL